MDRGRGAVRIDAHRTRRTCTRLEQVRLGVPALLGHEWRRSIEALGCRCDTCRRGVMPHQNETMLRDLYAAAAEGDVERLRQLIHPDIV